MYMYVYGQHVYVTGPTEYIEGPRKYAWGLLYGRVARERVRREEGGGTVHSANEQEGESVYKARANARERTCTQARGGQPKGGFTAVGGKKGERRKANEGGDEGEGVRM